MKMASKRKTIEVQNTSIALISREQDDYLSLTDIARYRNDAEPFSVINNWMRSRATIEFHGLWETLHNESFKPIEFERFRNEAGSNYFVLCTLAKVNYRIHTDAIKEKLIPAQVTRKQSNEIYASEADLLNVALFGKTAKQWRDANPGKEGNIRDHAALEQLVVLSNLESINALLVHQGMVTSERLIKLNETAITQMKSLLTNTELKKLK